MIAEVVVAGLLMDAGIEDVFVKRPGIMECADPVTIGRAIDTEARRVAEACELAIRDGSWERYGDDAVVSVEAAAPKFKEQDSSGRYVYEVGATIVADRCE